MPIRKLVFHRITRWEDDQPSNITTGSVVTNANADEQAMFGQFKKLFQFRAGKHYGGFTEDIGSAPFVGWIGEYLDDRTSFESLADSYLKQLKELGDKTSESFDRHVLIVDEEHPDGDRFWIMLLEDSSGLRIDPQHSLIPVDYLNTSKLELAARIDVQDIDRSNSDAPYLTLVKGRGASKLGEAFQQSIGFKNSVDTQKETEALIEVIASYTKDSEPEDSAKLRQRAYDFCVEQQQLGEAVPLSELSGYLDEHQPTKFAEFAEQQGTIQSQQTLRPDTRKLKHLVRMSGKGNGLSLSFSSDLFQQTILYDERSDTLTITAIPKSLKKQLTEYLKEKDQD